MKKTPHKVICFILLCLLQGCGVSYQWSKSHPLYKDAPTKSITVTGLSDAFVVTRSGWFAKRLDVSKDSIQTFASGYSSRMFLEELQKIYPTVNIIPDSSINKFSEESQKLSDRIFMKGFLPDQGVEVKDVNGNVPSQILIIHEFILGTDLKREDFFDYALIHNEEATKKGAENLTAIYSFTLWDNLKQRPLYSAVNEIQQPIQKFTLEDIKKIVTKAALQIRKDLAEGVQ